MENLTLKERLFRDYAANDNPKILTIAVRLPSGAIEVITNYEDFDSKIGYYFSAYDEDFKLKSNPQVQVVGYMLI